MRTDVGLVREQNQDAAYIDPAGRFVIVADGMGGNKAGEIASAMAVDVVRTLLDASRVELAAYAGAPRAGMRPRIQTLLERAVRLANEAVYERSRHEEDKHEMGTTLEVVLLLAGEAFVAHVGDCRTYLVRDGAAILTTTDHSVAEVMRRAGTISDDEAKTSPMRSVLANAIGVTEIVTVDHAHVELQPGDRLLVCSDGLYDYFDDDDLVDHVVEGTIDEALAALVVESQLRGGHDNITGVLIDVLSAEAVAVLEPLDELTTNPIDIPVERTETTWPGH
jgi:PPM family protein phosphatase